MIRSIVGGLMALGLVLGGAARARADIIPYPTPGVENPVIYAFTASSSAHVIAYFAGSTAAFTNELGLLVNGVDTGIYGLNNHASALGDALDFGPVTAGDALTFVLWNISPGIGKAYSDPTLNGPYDGGVGHQHVYATPYTATGPIIHPSIPAGTYVAFEDLPGGGDNNYFDENFVFTNVAAAAATPEPATLTMLTIGAFSLAGYGWRKRRQTATAE